MCHPVQQINKVKPKLQSFLPQAAEHIAALKSHAFYLLHVHLKQGYDLAAKVQYK